MKSLAQYIGTWDEHKDALMTLPVVTRQTISHFYGQHEGGLPYQFCLLCEGPSEEAIMAAAGVLCEEESGVPLKGDTPCSLHVGDAELVAKAIWKKEFGR